MAWPKGKPRKAVEQPVVSEDVPLVWLNRQAQQHDKGRRDVVNEIVAGGLRVIEEKLGRDYAVRAAGPLRALIRAVVEKGTLPGVKNKPLRLPVQATQPVKAA